MLVEHAAGPSLAGDLLVFSLSNEPSASWQVENVTTVTGQKVASPVTSWLSHDGPEEVEHLAGLSATGDLLVFSRSPAMDWQSVNVSTITGQKIDSLVTSWLTKDGSSLVEHLAGKSPAGDLLVFWRSPQVDCRSINVSTITWQKIAGPVASWQIQDGPHLLEHLAGQSPTGDLIVFWWSPQSDWRSNQRFCHYRAEDRRPGNELAEPGRSVPRGAPGPVGARLTT